MGFIQEHSKELSDVTARSLNDFWMVLVFGEVPVNWNLANFVPVFKKGKKDDPETYRPVSLTSMTDKIIEKIIL